MRKHCVTGSVNLRFLTWRVLVRIWLKCVVENDPTLSIGGNGVTVSYRFDEVVQRKTCKVLCTLCKRKRNKVVSEGYYENGMHNVQETRASNWVKIDAQIAKLEAEGLICQTCVYAQERGVWNAKGIAGRGDKVVFVQAMAVPNDHLSWGRKLENNEEYTVLETEYDRYRDQHSHRL